MNKTKKFLLLLRDLQPVFANRDDLDELKKNIDHLINDNKLLSNAHSFVEKDKYKLTVKMILRLKMYWIEIKQTLLSIPEEISAELYGRDK